MQKLSVTIITFNEAHNILRCLKSVKNIADEIIVVDSFSTDNTVELCRNFGARVIQEPWAGYSEAKNFANSITTNNWIFSIDADEEVSGLLEKEILEAKSAGFTGHYSVNRLTNYMGNWIYHGGWYPDKKIRLFNKNAAAWTGELVHEELEIEANSTEKQFKGPLYHYSYRSTVDHYNRAKKYSRLTALKMFRKGKKPFPFKPVISVIARFIAMYIIKGGFLDGKAGLIISWISAKANYIKYKELQRLWREKE